MKLSHPSPRPLEDAGEAGVFGLAGCLLGGVLAVAVDRGALSPRHGRSTVRFRRWGLPLPLPHALLLGLHPLLLGVHRGNRLLELGVLGVTLLEQCLLLLEVAYLLGVGGGRASG